MNTTFSFWPIGRQIKTITKIRFFENFYGEVSSMSFLLQKEYGYPGVNSSDFLLVFKQYKEGLWKKKKIDDNLIRTDLILEKNISKNGIIESSYGQIKVINNINSKTLFIVTNSAFFV